ncbi:MAG: single-stranded DNA-binding protein [Deltaproteobacteria bacterium]|nr:single-stranded DNA-binding protein [Deltaproteobacteria bacterium]
MSNLNKVMLIGRLGKDPEVRHTQSGQKVANFSLATSDFWKDKQGAKQERTEWHNVVAWGFQAEFAEKYLQKGRLVFVEGRLQTSDWTDKENVKRYKTEIVANVVQGLDRPAEGAGQGGGQSRGGGQDYDVRAGQGGKRDYGKGSGKVREDGPPQSSYDQGPPPEEPYMEDDIPF